MKENQGVTLRFGFFCVCRSFCHRTESDLFFFSPKDSFLNKKDFILMKENQ